MPLTVANHMALMPSKWVGNIMLRKQSQSKAFDPTARSNIAVTKESKITSRYLSLGSKSPILDGLGNAFGPPLTVGEVARFLGVGEDVVRDRIRNGELRAVKIGGRWRIWSADIAEYLISALEKQ